MSFPENLAPEESGTFPAFYLVDPPAHAELDPRGYPCGCIVMVPRDAEARCPEHGEWP